MWFCLNADSIYAVASFFWHLNLKCKLQTLCRKFLSGSELVWHFFDHIMHKPMNATKLLMCILCTFVDFCCLFISSCIIVDFIFIYTKSQKLMDIEANRQDSMQELSLSGQMHYTAHSEIEISIYMAC